jgi:hypothetical protein
MYTAALFACTQMYTGNKYKNNLMSFPAFRLHRMPVTHITRHFYGVANVPLFQFPIPYFNTDFSQRRHCGNLYS